MSVYSYTNDEASYTTSGATDRPRENGTVAPSPSREETRKRAATKTGEGDSAPHKHAVAARPSPRPAGAAVHALFDRTRRARPCSYLKGKQYPQQAATQKVTVDAKNSRKDPAQHRLVDLFTSSRDPPTEPRHQSEKQTPCTHRNTRSALKNMSVERGKAGVPLRGPCNKADAASYSPRPQPSAHTPRTSADPRRRRPTSVPTTTTENAAARAASTPSRGIRPPEPAPVPRAKRATAHATRFAPLAQARRRRVTCLELADRFPTTKLLNDGRTEPFRTSRRAPRCAARGPSRRT